MSSYRWVCLFMKIMRNYRSLDKARRPCHVTINSKPKVKTPYRNAKRGSITQYTKHKKTNIQKVRHHMVSGLCSFGQNHSLPGSGYAVVVRFRMMCDPYPCYACVCVRALNVNVNIQCQSNKITRNAAENNSRKTI